ncbi:MAG: hybrid sensor histidine kinase/response regulator [Isosphaeraceae bacterium]
MQRTRTRPRVLVVDDEPEVLSSVRDLLRIDYHVLTAQRGAEALEILRADPEITVVLTDQRMPGMSGVEVLHEAREIRPEASRLLFTAYTEIHTVIGAINQGNVFRYITKPWLPEELESVVRQAVERHDLIVEKNRLLRELQESNAKLAEANRLKGVFLEVASHELNTPVSVVLGLTDLWKMSLDRSGGGPERQWVERINHAARRLARTVQRMFKLIEDREFGRTLQLEEVAPEALIREVLDQLSPYLEARQQTVQLRIADGLGTIEADSSKLTDVLVNLLANAIKFTPDRGTIRIVAEPVEGEADAGGLVRVLVQDEGIGVHPGEQPYLFEPFFTGFDTLHHSSGDFQFGKRGIGLGLCLVKSFIALHGGHVEMQSHPGKGSSFGFVLPRTQRAAGGADGGSAGHRTDGTSPPLLEAARVV